MTSAGHHRRALIRLLGLAAAGHALPALAPLAPPLARALRIPRTLGGDGVALTFDDGPHPEGTVAVLEGLREAGATAAFFLVGEQVRSNPSLAAEIVAAGHTVELHGDRHRNQLRLTPAQMFEDMRRGAAAIEEASGRAPRFYRPPYGIFSAAGLWTVNRSRWRPLLWSRWAHDWRRIASAESIAAEASRDLDPGDVVLLHDSDAYSAAGSWVKTAAALPAILEQIDAHGLTPAGLGSPVSALNRPFEPA
jgi:peptidoglycan-N-acetylglucosamine deacetylase